jgi:regulator of sigma D
MPILVQSLKLRLKQLYTEYKDDAELLALVPYPDGDYEPQSDNGVFGKAWQEWDEIGGFSELVDRWLDFEAGRGVFDHFCEIKGTYVQVPKVAEVEKKPPKKPSKKAPKPVEVKMRNGYAPLRVSKDLELKNFPKSIKDWVEKIFEAIQKVVAARALKKFNDDKAAALKKKLEELVATNRQAVAFAAAAVPVFNAAAAA